MAEYLELNQDDSGDSQHWKNHPRPPRPEEPHRHRSNWGKHIWKIVVLFVIILVIVSIPMYFNDVGECMNEKKSNLGKASCLVTSLPSLLSGCSHRNVSRVPIQIKGVDPEINALVSTPMN